MSLKVGHLEKTNFRFSQKKSSTVHKDYDP